MATYRFPTGETEIIVPEASVLVNQLLALRGITNYTEAKAFLEPNYETQLHDPFLLNDMNKADRKSVV